VKLNQRSLLCFSSKQTEINVFSLFSTSLGTDCPRISLYPFSLCSFCFFLILFSLNFIFVSLQMRKQAKKYFFRIKAKNFISISLHFASKRKLRQFLLLICFVFVSFHFISL
jgi:hypothetical protein